LTFFIQVLSETVWEEIYNQLPLPAVHNQSYRGFTKDELMNVYPEKEKYAVIFKAAQVFL